MVKLTDNHLVKAGIDAAFNGVAIFNDVITSGADSLTLRTVIDGFAPSDLVFRRRLSRDIISPHKFKRRVFQFPIKEPSQIDIQAAFPQRQQTLQTGLIFLFVRLIVPVGVRLIHVSFRVIHVFDKGDILSARGLAFIILDGVDTQSGTDKFSGVRPICDYVKRIAANGLRIVFSSAFKPHDAGTVLIGHSLWRQIVAGFF